MNRDPMESVPPALDDESEVPAENAPAVDAEVVPEVRDNMTSAPGIAPAAEDQAENPTEAQEAYPVCAGIEPSTEAIEPGAEAAQPEIGTEHEAFEPIVEMPQAPLEVEPAPPEVRIWMPLAACVAGAIFPGLGHAVLRKWDRALVFLGSITLMFMLGLSLDGRLFSPDFSDLFTSLKFIADAGTGSLYWLCFMRGMGVGDPAVYTYDFGNVFIYTAGLLNMLVIVDAFDISVGRKP
jgi:hypothetical protein